MRTTLLTLLLAGSIPLTVNAAETISGLVVDPASKPIVRATVATDQPGRVAITDQDGRFALPLEVVIDGKTISIGTITVSSVGFLPRQFNRSNLPDTIVLEPVMYEQEGVMITANRATRDRSPIAYSNVTRQQIVRDQTVGDIPLLLQATPNLYSYTDAGGNLGYTYTQIRGFDDKRIATYVNGVPLNDPEDQFSYWVDLPDFAGGVTDIQVQRGVGNSLYGDASFGGSINVISNTLSLPKSATLTAGYGEFLDNGKSIGSTNKQTVSFATGLLDNQYAVSGRYVKQRSDGYRRNSWAESWAYQFGIARLDPNMTTELQLFGGPQKLHLAFLGVTKDQIASDRRFNPLTFDGETDAFSQPHYQLHHHWFLSTRTTLSNTFYFIRGKGAYEQQITDALYADYNIDSLTTAGATNGSIVRKQSVEKYQVGWNPSIEIRHQKGTHTFGGSAYLFASDHVGNVVWAEGVSSSLEPNRRYYRYTGDKLVASIYAQEKLDLTSRLRTQATLQLRYQRYEFNQDKLGAFAGFAYTVNWMHLSPRIGFVYALEESSTLTHTLYLNAAIASRTPTDAAIYDASSPYSFPSLVVDQISFSPYGDSVFTFGDPTTKAESVFNLEIGTNVRTSRFSGGLNFYWMDLRDEIIPYGGVNPSNGLAATVNTSGSYRIGLEAEGRIVVSDQFTLSGSGAINRYRIKQFTDTLDVYDDTFAVIDQTIVTYRDKVGLGFPELLGSLTADLQTGNLQTTIRVTGSGKQYMELVNIDSLTIPTQATVSLSFRYKIGHIPSFGQLELSGTIDNLFNAEMLRGGYGWNYAYAPSVGAPVSLLGGAEYYVAAKRSFFLQAKLDLL